VALEIVELPDRADHFPAQLSGGEQQRIAIARALASNPELLLCDEPTGALDLETGRRILATLDRVTEQLGKVVILVTHNSAIAEMADRVVKLGSGRIEHITDHEKPVPALEVTW
jgi:putative ABC transport system ATP-binding protein